MGKERMPKPERFIQWNEHISEEEIERIRNSDEDYDAQKRGHAKSDDDFWLPDIEERMSLTTYDRDGY